MMTVKRNVTEALEALRELSAAGQALKADGELEEERGKRMEKINILVSACLLGLDCRYSGTGKYIAGLEELKEEFQFIPVCPEQLGGLPTPRSPVEITEGRAVNKEGADCTEQFKKGAQEAGKLAGYFNCRAALLKANSPSCGFGRIYDGSFSGKLIEGNGITAELLHKKGLKIYSEKDLKDLKDLKDVKKLKDVKNLKDLKDQ